MAFCPLDYRYGNQDFKHIWSESGRHERQLEVERALIWAHWQLGRVSEDDYTAVAAISNPESVRKERVSEIEAETRHDIMALTKAMAEAAGDAGWCIHLGATSNDIVDTAVALQLRDSIVLLREQLCLLIGVCADVAERERDTVMLGRTHGQAAVPITFGLKAAVWLDEMRRQLIRLDEATPRIAVGKFLGAVGTGAAQGENARELQRLILTTSNLAFPSLRHKLLAVIDTSSMYHGSQTWQQPVRRFSKRSATCNAQNCPKLVRDLTSRSKSVHQQWLTKRTLSSLKTPQVLHELFARSSYQPTKTLSFGTSVILRIQAVNDSRCPTLALVRRCHRKNSTSADQHVGRC